MLDIRQAEGAKLVDINQAMFRKPNAKAFELVLYHAYCTINGKAAAKKVCTCEKAIAQDKTAPQLLTSCILSHPCRTFEACGRLWTRTGNKARISIRCEGLHECPHHEPHQHHEPHVHQQAVMDHALRTAVRPSTNVFGC
jgi:hypothetical protein